MCYHISLYTASTRKSLLKGKKRTPNVSESKLLLRSGNLITVELVNPLTEVWWVTLILSFLIPNQSESFS